MADKADKTVTGRHSRKGYLEGLSLTLVPVKPTKQVRSTKPVRSTKSTKSAKAKKPTRTDLTLVGIPPELHLELFQHLDKVTSTCLGLTCKIFYSIHRAIHGKVKLKSPSGTPTYMVHPDGRTRDLTRLISKWMGPDYHWMGWERGKFKKICFKTWRQMEKEYIKAEQKKRKAGEDVESAGRVTRRKLES
jgi:hypothetical protein